MDVEPFGEVRADLRSGIIASTIANVNRDPKKGKPFQASDFMPKFDEARERKPRGSNSRKKMTQSKWEEFKQTIHKLGQQQEAKKAPTKTPKRSHINQPPR